MSNTTLPGATTHDPGQAYTAPSDDTGGDSTDPTPRDVATTSNTSPTSTAEPLVPGLIARPSTIGLATKESLHGSKSSPETTGQLHSRPVRSPTRPLSRSPLGARSMLVSTSALKTTAIAINFPPNSEVVFYQKRYSFRDSTTFVNDAWGQEWNAGPWGGYNPLTTKTSYVEIMADEYFTNNAPLNSGTGSIQCTSVSQAQRTGTTSKRENLTGACKDKPSAMGL
ncbi:hypothetical protein BJ165DRAFT_1593394 [Panaeolus papilionaceus]|nr:hypothetical protein BJ165DRAFT_1593394 [Panaeolus papilionaceus]